MAAEAPQALYQIFADTTGERLSPVEIDGRSQHLFWGAWGIAQRGPHERSGVLYNPGNGPTNPFRHATDAVLVRAKGKSYKLKMQEEFVAKKINPGSTNYHTAERIDIEGVALMATDEGGNDQRLYFFTPNEGVKDWKGNKIETLEGLDNASKMLDFMSTAVPVRNLRNLF